MGQILYAGAIHRTKQAEIDAARITQKSGNEKRAAVSELQRFSQSLGNQRLMEAAGDRAGAISENLTRNLDAAATGLLGSRIAAAEELGANMAGAAAAGVGGSTIDILNETARLSQSMREEQGERDVRYGERAALSDRGNTLTDAVAGMGNDVIRADMDYRQYVDHHKPGLFTRLSTLATAAAATVYGGPQAGQAVLSLYDAGQDASNGDFASASRGLTSAIQGGIAGAKVYRAGGEDGGGGPWAGQFFKHGRAGPATNANEGAGVNNVSRTLYSSASAHLKI